MQALIQVERNGVLIDSKILQKQSQEIGEKLIKLEKEAFILADQPFNLSSPKQLQEILFDKLEIKPIKKTPTGKPSTSEEVLQILAQDYPLPKLILEHRSLSKLKTTYTDKLPKMINKNTAAIMVETILGEGGIKVIPDWCLKGLRKICNKNKILLILDEVQCGIGRTGDFFAFEKSRIKPDIVPIAKGIGGGFPIAVSYTHLTLPTKA